MNRTTSRALTRAAAPLIVGMVVALGVAPAAHASSTTKKDPAGDHVSGQTANLDLAKVSMRTTAGKKKIKITIGLHNDVTAADLAFPSGMGVIFHRGKGIFRGAEITSRDGVLEADICTYDTRKEQVPTPKNCSSVRLTQVDGKTFRMLVKVKQVKKGATVLKWHASAFSVTSMAVDPLGHGARKPYTWRL